MRVLVVNRHALTWTVGPAGDHVPAPPADRYLVTRTFGGGLAGWDPAAFGNLTVLDMDHPDRIEAAAGWLIGTYGIERVVALHEKDLLLAARLRADHGLAGPDPATTLRFRDKVRMKDALAAAGYPDLPRYRALAPGEVLAAAPWPGRLVVKSRWGVGSSQVRIVDGVAAADAAARELEQRGDELEVEEFVAGDMYHCDAVVVDGAVRFAAVSEYLARPGQYGAGRVAGSVLVPDGPVRAAVRAATEQVLRLLGLDAGVTHVEFFRDPSGRLVFCEAAARPGGGGISDIVARAYGVDLVRAAVELQCGVPPALPADDAVPDRVVGVVGVYHSGTGADAPAPDLPGRVPGVASYGFARQEVPGRVRHCTDYAHTMVVTGRTRAEFDRTAALAVAAVRGPGAGR